MKLTIELVPETSWYTNVRSKVSPEEWDVLRRATYRKANYLCEICGGKGPSHPVECHEIWQYDDLKHTQTLIGLIALCPACHEVKHIGRAQIMGDYDRAIKHLCKVNGWKKTTGEAYINDSAHVWRERSKHNWEVDISWLKGALK